LPDENQVLLRVPRENNMYNVDLKNIVPSRDLTCLFAKVSKNNMLQKKQGRMMFNNMCFFLYGLLTKKHEDKTKKEAKGKSLVESSTGYRNLSAEFEDFSNNSINEINAADSLVPAVGKISTDTTNTFSAAGPSNAAVSPTHGKSSYVNTSQYPDDPNMLELEDITYSDDEEDVGA
nr:hypothetical protein [Tanacetum cinerariifolium]